MGAVVGGGQCGDFVSIRVSSPFVCYYILTYADAVPLLVLQYLLNNPALCNGFNRTIGGVEKRDHIRLWDVGWCFEHA
jgi:hypothetical protein